MCALGCVGTGVCMPRQAMQLRALAGVMKVLKSCLCVCVCVFPSVRCSYMTTYIFGTMMTNRKDANLLSLASLLSTVIPVVFW